MRISVKYAIWLLALMPLVQGCDQKTQKAQTQTLAPPIVDAPPTKPATVSTADLPPPVVGDPTAKPATDDTAAKPAEPPKKPVHHPKKPATPASQETANATPPATTEPSVSAIGQLSGGASGDQRSETQDSINSTEKGVNSITRTLTDAEAKTASQIHEFLKQAREALASGDVDGAKTLAIKAKVLLNELNPQ